MIPRLLSSARTGNPMGPRKEQPTSHQNVDITSKLKTNRGGPFRPHRRFLRPGPGASTVNMTDGVLTSWLSPRQITATILLSILYPALSFSVTQIRRSTLESWSGGKELGWIVEEKRTDNVLQVTVGLTGSDVCRTVELPMPRDNGRLSASLWTSALAGAVLFRSETFSMILEGGSLLELGSSLGLGGLVCAAGGGGSVRRID